MTPTVLFDDEGMFESIYSKIKSNDWWVFISSYETLDKVKKIEESHYGPNTDATNDFELVIIGEPNPAGIIVSYAKKSRMNKEQLNAILGSHYTIANHQEADIRLLMNPGINRPINQHMQTFFNELIAYVVKREKQQ